MRTVVFRVLAGLLSLAFVALLVFGVTSQIPARDQVGVGVIGLGRPHNRIKINGSQREIKP